MNRSVIVLAVACLATAVLPQTTADTTVADIALGNAISSDFEDGPQGWTASVVTPPTRPPPVGTWAWGAPTSGPGIAASGSNVWATNLSGNYTNSECAAIMSPPISLAGATSASASFKHWRHFEQTTSTGTGWDAGVVMVTLDGGETLTILTPTGASYTTNSLSTSARTCFNGAATTQKGFTGPFGTTLPAPVYNSSAVDLTAYAGQTIQVLLAFGSDGTGVRAGWYVDDFALTVDGVTTTTDFEADNGGFTIVGTKIPPAAPQGWEHGLPTTGPGNATSLWATNLDGNYGPNECNWVESPAFTVGPIPNEGNAVVDATLSWTQWYRSSSVSAAGVVQIGDETGYTIVSPTGGYPATPTSTVLDACLGHLAGGQGAFAGLIDPVGGPMTEFRADITPWLGKEITIRFLFASTTSTVTNEGWYVDDVNVDVHADVTLPDPEDVVPALGSTDAPLWTSGGNKSSWAYGVATTGPANETVYKTNLAGNYNSLECSWIQSPSIPGTLLGASPTLKFDHWYKMESIVTNSTWDAGVILISTDDGATWSYLNLTDYDRPMTTTTIKNCVGSHGVAPSVNVFSGNHTAAFETVNADLSAFAGASSVTFRFLFGSDASVQYDGWAIKNVEIAGVKVL